MTARIEAIDYGNFKNSVKNDELHDLYMNFWKIHSRHQEQDRSGRQRDRSSQMAWGPGDVEHHLGETKSK